MKKLSVLSGMILTALLGCDSSPQPSNNGVSEIERELPSSEQVNSRHYAARPTLNTWPEGDAEGVQLANNLTATNYYLVLDGSGSMAESRCSGNTNKMEAAKQAVSAFAQQIPADANLGLFVFDTNGTDERVALGPNNREQMIDAIRKVRANGGTPLKNAITQGYRSLERQAKKQLGYGEYHLVVITDGEAGSSQKPDKIVKQILNESPVVIHTIGFCIEGGHSLNQQGRINYKQANDPQSLSQGLQDVLAEAPAFQSDRFDG